MLGLIVFCAAIANGAFEEKMRVTTQPKNLILQLLSSLNFFDKIRGFRDKFLSLELVHQNKNMNRKYKL